MKVELQLDTRSKLLKSAVQVFAKEGFAGASVRQIADLAGVNHGSIKYHYSSKNQLWRAGVAYLFGEMERVVFANEEQWESMSPREQMVDHISTYVRFNAAHPELLRMVMFESMVRSDRFEWLSENYLRPFTDRAVNRVVLAQEEGTYRADIPPLNLYYMNIAASRSILFAAPELKKQQGIDMFAEEEIERHIDAMIKLFVLPEETKG
ncbi:MAG: TetR/AcrR family transcriptional regulator [Erythrobacter sp.]